MTMAKVKSRFYWKIKDSEDRPAVPHADAVEPPLPQLVYAPRGCRRVKQMQVSRDQVFAYVSRRGEEEVIVL